MKKFTLLLTVLVCLGMALMAKAENPKQPITEPGDSAIVQTVTLKDGVTYEISWKPEVRGYWVTFHNPFSRRISVSYKLYSNTCGKWIQGAGYVNAHSSSGWSAGDRDTILEVTWDWYDNY